MKKSIKILTLVLSLALICGALVVAAFADDTNEITGIRVDASADFENPLNSVIGKPEASATEAKNKTTNLDQDNGAAKVLMLKYQYAKNEMDGAGDALLVTNPNDSNTYVTIEWKGQNAGAGHFLEHYTAINGWGTYTDDSKEYFDEFKYYVVDFDLAYFDVANYDGKGFFYPYVVYTNAAGGGRVEAVSQIGLNFTKSNGQVAATFRGGDGTKYAVGNDKWSHVTWIMEPIASADTKSLTLKQYLAIDGEVVGIYEWTNAFSTDNMYNGDHTKLYTLDVRFNAFGMSGSAGHVDNYNFRTLMPEYNGNLATVLADGVGADLTAFESSLYKADYKMPFGKLVATVGETPYDSIEKAVVAAAGATPVVLKGNVTMPLVINQAATIECGEYTIANVTTGEGINVTYDEATKTYTFEETQDRFPIIWGACECGLEGCDDTHPGTLETLGWPGTTMAATYTKNLEWVLDLGLDVYTLAGWKNTETGEMVDINAVITTEMCADPGYIMLTPVIEKSVADVTYVQGGTTKYATGANAFKTAITNADADSVVQLLNDTVYTPAAAISVNKNVTLDLNGHVLDMLTTYKGNGWINVGAGKTFTVLGEKEGSALIAGYSKGANAAGGTLFTSGDNATITLKGKGLFVSCAALYGKWADLHVTINIEDCYINHNVASENTANIYVSAGDGTKSAYTLNIKNATVNGLTLAVNCPNTTVESVINIENSVILSNMLNASYNPNTVVNVKGNSYIYGSFKCAKAVNVSGANNYFTSNDWIDKATFEGGKTLVSENLKADHTNYTHPWVVSAKDAAWDKAATLAITNVTVSQTYTYTAAVSISVNFYDGETLLATVVSRPGVTVIGPAAGASYPVADGWVMATNSYVYTIPADATGTVNVDIKDITDYSVAYTKGTPKLYLNFDITDNLCANLYAPKVLPEGIEDFGVYIDSALRSFAYGYIIGGEEYGVTNRWPGGSGADDAQIWIVKFTYEGTEFTFNANANITDYAKKVYKMYADNAEKMEQMTALLQYVNAANKIANNTPAAAFTELYNEMMAKYTIREVPEVEGNVDALSAYLGSAQVYAGYNSGMQFKINDTSVTYKIVTTKGTVGKVETANGTQSTVKAGHLTTGNYNFGSWAATPFTIQVLNGEEVIASGEYSLAAYYTAIKDTASAEELAVLQAMYVLGAIGNVNG